MKNLYLNPCLIGETLGYTNLYEIWAKMSDQAIVTALGVESDFGLTILNRLKISKCDRQIKLKRSEGRTQLQCQDKDKRSLSDSNLQYLTFALVHLTIP